MKCIRFDVCKDRVGYRQCLQLSSSMKCIRFDVCKQALRFIQGMATTPQ